MSRDGEQFALVPHPERRLGGRCSDQRSVMEEYKLECYTDQANQATNKYHPICSEKVFLPCNTIIEKLWERQGKGQVL